MKQKFIEWFTKNNNGCSPAMEDDRSFVYEMTQHMFEAYQAGVAEVRAQGVEMFAAVLRRKGDDAFFDAIAEAQANAADQFAAQLRQGGAA
ncbi:hypothetical protein NQ094_05420 [Enterobacter kobei]|uniref:hypothetical protein n=1 Tax=Enterobacter kobei TaxID=208224 RepID=UPI00214A734B|nr:hypothetical protein [Enterobacter kobei]MCR2795476.1 hypothetical protein [Enterobacter kobei]